METALPSIIEKVLGQGLLGAIVVAQFFVAKHLLQQERDEKKAALAEVARLNGVMQEKTVPALVSATNAVADAAGVLRDVQYRHDVAAEAAAKRKE